MVRKWPERGIGRVPARGSENLRRGRWNLRTLEGYGKGGERTEEDDEVNGAVRVTAVVK